MKKTIIIIGLILLLVAATALAGCRTVLLSEQNGPVITREYEFTDFTGIEVGHAFELEVTPSDTYKVTITAGEKVLDRIDVKKAGGILNFDINDLFFTWNTRPKVAIAMPVLRDLDMSGASKGNVRGFKSAEDFNLVLSGASELDLDMETGDFTADISGASRLAGFIKAASSHIELSGASRSELKGAGGDMILDASGASHVNMIDFAVEDAHIELSGASYAGLTIDGELNADLSGASSLEYGGNPTLGSLDLTGASSIERKD